MADLEIRTAGEAEDYSLEYLIQHPPEGFAGRLDVAAIMHFPITKQWKVAFFAEGREQLLSVLFSFDGSAITQNWE